MPPKSIYFVLAAAVAVALSGCSSTTRNAVSSNPATSSTVRIVTQPLSQTVPLGASATFTVKATGDGPLSYQWTRNGAEVDGAVGASYTIASLTSTDNGASYAVRIKDQNGKATSTSALLTAGTRSPAAGDLRLLLFQQATASGLGDSSESSSLSPNTAALYPGAVGSPLELGSAAVCKAGVEYGCGWNFFVESLPTSQNGLTMLYQGRDYQHFESDLDTISAPNVVIHSLDLEPDNRAYAVSWVSTLADGGFDLRREVVASAEVDAAVAQDGNESRVVTAVSFDCNGQANVLSYGWTGDTRTVFETRTRLTTIDSVVKEAQNLAAAGYIISAFGGNDANGYLLVGTRVQGDTIPRTLSVTTAVSSYSTSSAKQTAYSTPVIRFAGGDGAQTLISEY